jgi:hypothetical protein
MSKSKVLTETRFETYHAHCGLKEEKATTFKKPLHTKHIKHYRHHHGERLAICAGCKDIIKSGQAVVRHFYNQAE